LGRAQVVSNGGIQVDYGGRRYLLDPSGPGKADFTFVSHAHIDHIHNPLRGEKVISSEATKELAVVRGYDLGETIEELEGVELLDSGHILGSRAIKIQDEVYYTGDASGRERAFLGRCVTRRTRVLIMESTYGSPEYSFPKIDELVKEVNALVAETYDRGRPVVLMGYPLGKAQVLSYFFSSWGPLFLHERVAEMNEVHRRHGVPLKAGKRFDPEQDSDSLPAGPWLMIAPLSSGRSSLMSYLRKRYGAVLVAFSGWASAGGYARSIGADFAFPLSDHCDYPELLRLAREVSPEVVYTTHGFAEEFARELRRNGFSATSLGSHQSSLHEFAGGEYPD